MFVYTWIPSYSIYCIYSEWRLPGYHWIFLPIIFFNLAYMMPWACLKIPTTAFFNKAFLRQWRNKVSVSCESIISGCIFYHAMSLIKLVPFFLWTASYAVQTLPPLFFLLVFPSELMVVKTKCWYPQWEIYSERQTGLFMVNKYLIYITSKQF